MDRNHYPAKSDQVRVLLVEDEPSAAEMLAKGLREEGFEVDVAPDGLEASRLANAAPYDLMILDILLPGMDGISLCREARGRGNDVPILMVTARDSLDDRIIGLDAGADDYLTKPFDYGELLARIRALLRRRQSRYRESIVVGDLTVDLRTRSITRAGLPVDLSAREYALLEYLALRAGELVSREAISEYVWDEDYNAFTNLIEVYVLRLRRKIDSGHAVKLIRTRRGEGYMLSAEPGR